MFTRFIRSRLVVRMALVCGALALSLLPASPLMAVLLVNQKFNTDTATTAATLLTYPEFTLNNGTSATVSGGVLNLVSGAGGGNSFTVNGASFPSKFLVKTDLGALDPTVSPPFNGGSDAIGLRIGNWAFVFFPTYPNGALQIRTVGGSGEPAGAPIGGDHSITFTPAVNTMHHMEIDVDGQDFEIRITNGNSPFQTGTVNFTPNGSVSQPFYVPGPVGLTNLNQFTGLYDNFVVDDFQIVPEPSTGLLLGLGGLGLVAYRRRRSRR